MDDLSARLERYADLIIKTGVNLQPGQSLHLSADLEHAPFVRLLTAKAYDAGARFVSINWLDALSTRARLRHSQPDYLDYFPEFEVPHYRQLVDEGWARLSLVGPEFPDAMDDVEPDAMRRTAKARRKHLKFYSDAVMSNQFQWCVAAVPTRAWSRQIFPELEADAAVARVWELILATCRVNEADPAAAWTDHDAALNRVVHFMDARQIRALHYLDPTPGPDDRPRTQLTIGLTDRPRWIAASSQTPAGVRFFANMPTEEVFTTPHRLRTTGWARTTKPFFPFERQVDDAYFRFENGEVVEFSATTGREVLEQFFAMDGARLLGEVALVDVRSPVNQAGVIFYETLFDENAVCHMAFGDAYLEGYAGSEELAEADYAAAGINKADVHLDVMIGSDTLQITGVCADGSEVPIMENGRFVAEVMA